MLFLNFIFYVNSMINYNDYNEMNKRCSLMENTSIELSRDLSLNQNRGTFILPDIKKNDYNEV